MRKNANHLTRLERYFMENEQVFATMADQKERQIQKTCQLLSD